MSTEIRRDDSFRTAIKNQKRRLSATKLPTFSPERRKSSIMHADLKAVQLEMAGERRKSRSGSLPDIKVLKFHDHNEAEEDSELIQEKVVASEAGSSPDLRRIESPPPPPPPPQTPFEDDNTENKSPPMPLSQAAPPLTQTSTRPQTPPNPTKLDLPLQIKREKSPNLMQQQRPQSPSSPLGQRPQSPYTPKRPSPLVIQQKSPGSSNNLHTIPLTPGSPSLARSKSPVPPDSPLLSSSRTPTSPVVKRARELRRAGSFRRSLERSRERSKSRADQAAREKEKEHVEEVSFSIRRHLGGRQGWKIMPEAMGATLNPEAVKAVVGMIKEMELSGHQIPERITIRV
jgi:hypothetical protein